jgi:hypothetical protein
VAKRKKNSNASRKAKAKRTELPGVSLEKAVASVQQMMDPNTTVCHNQKLEDRFGILRQFDVVIRGSFAGRPALGVIECRDHKKKRGLADVEAFSKKCDNVLANLRLMVSRTGFTKSALELALKEGIGCLSLVPKDHDQVGWSIGSYAYGKLGRWVEPLLGLGFAVSPSPLPEEVAARLSTQSVLWQGLPVVHWFLREMFANHGLEKQPGTYLFRANFGQVRMLTVAGKEYAVKEVSCKARWEVKKKRIWMKWSGDAIYDWHKNRIDVPANVEMIGGPIEPDPRLWEDYDGEIPMSQSSITFLAQFGQILTKGVSAPELPIVGPLTVTGPLAS